MPSRLYAESPIPPEFCAYALERLVSRLAFTGYKRDEQRRVALHCLHNLVRAGFVDQCVADTRDCTVPGVRLRVRVWDAIVAAGLAEFHKGSEASGKRSRYRADDTLLAGFAGWPLECLLNLKLERNTMTPDEAVWDALVVLQDGGKLLPFPPEDLARNLGGFPLAAYLKVVENDIEFINRANMRHRWEAFKKLADGRIRGFQPNINLKQLHSGELLRYARLYTWDAASAQNLSQQERSWMRIDGESTAELDYAGLHIRLMHHLADYDPPRDRDPYKPEEVLPVASGGLHRDAARAFVKRATNVLLNTTSRAQAVGAVQNLTRTEAQGPLWAAMLRREDVSARDVVARIEAAHPHVAHQFFTDIGALLQTIDGIVMREVLRLFAVEDRPALGVHDSVVCRSSDAGFAEAMMTIAYHGHLRFNPVIVRKY